MTTSTATIPHIEPYQIANITLTYELPVKVNLAILGKYIPLGEEIVHTKCINVCEQGKVPSTKTNNTNKNSNKNSNKNTNNKTKPPKLWSKYDECFSNQKKDFSNQCTIDVHLPSDRQIVVNTKVFNNGKLVLTGCRKSEHALEAVKYLIKNLPREGQVCYKISSCKMLNDLRQLDLKTVRKDTFEDWPQSERKIFKKVRKMLMDKEPALRSWSRAWFGDSDWLSHLLTDLAEYSFHPVWDVVWQDQYLYFFKLFEIMDIYYHCDEMRDWNQAQWFASPILKAIIAAVDNDQIELVLPLGRLQEPGVASQEMTSPIPLSADPARLQIANINCTIKTNFEVDRTACTEVLNTEPRLSCDFKPISYPGVNVKYRSFVDCWWHGPKSIASQKWRELLSANLIYVSNPVWDLIEIILQKSESCRCKDVTVLIFQNRKFIITGTRSLEQVEDTHQFMSKCFKKHLPKIQINASQHVTEISISDYPDVVVRESKDDNYNIFLNKALIRANPHNFRWCRRHKA